MRYCLDGDDTVALGFLALIEFSRRLAVTNGKVGGLDMRPCQIAIAVLRVAFAFLFSIRDMNAADTATIRCIVANIGETLDTSGFKKNDCGENRPDT